MKENRSQQAEIDRLHMTLVEISEENREHINEKMVLRLEMSHMETQNETLKNRLEIRALEDSTDGGATKESEVPEEHRQSEGTTDRVGHRDSGGSDGVASYSAGTFTITAYTAGYESTQKQPGEPGYGITATGTQVQEGRTIAADWNVLPPGTVVQIEGLPGNYVVEDRGGAVNGQHIDLYVADLDRAQAWGRQTRHVTIVTVP